MRLIGTRMDRLAELIGVLRKKEDLPTLDAALAILLPRFAVDRNLYSEIFELSYSWDGEPHFARFSYAFPGWRVDPAPIARDLSSLVAPWGSAALQACQNLLERARHPAVEQPLFGLAQNRCKLYLQFRQGPLHILGFDLDERGVVSEKRYLISRQRLPGLPPLAYVLSVVRDGVPELLDFGLKENRLSENDLFGSEWASQNAAALAPLLELRKSFDLLVRRVSIGPKKLTLYYVLGEMDGEPSGARRGAPTSPWRGGCPK
jgi:hypothetical protein